MRGTRREAPRQTAAHGAFLLRTAAPRCNAAVWCARRATACPGLHHRKPISANADICRKPHCLLVCLKSARALLRYLKSNKDTSTAGRGIIFFPVSTEATPQ